MKAFVNEISENQLVDSFFVVRERTSGMTRTGNPYFKLMLGDRTGEIEGRIWTSAEAFADSFGKDDFVHLKGKAVSYQDRLQQNIILIERVPEEIICLSDFFPKTEKNIDEMLRSLIDISSLVKNRFLRQLLQLFWEDACFVDRFKIAPASKRVHHSYLGGLLEHSLSLAQLVLKNTSHFEGLNVDLLIAGAILHDVGKVDELSYQRSFDYSDEGRLLGHIFLGIERVEDKIRQLSDFPKELSTLLKHLLLSHHGQYIWGSPKRPMTLEAVMLHYLDDLDAKINGIKQFLKTDLPNGSNWSTYHRLFDQSFYAPGPWEETEPPDKADHGSSDS